MNNSKITLDNLTLGDDPIIDITPTLRAKEANLMTIIESLKNIATNRDWMILQERIFNEVVENLEKRLLSEAKKRPLDEGEIYSLNGQLTWARKYADLNKMVKDYWNELTNVRKQIQTYEQDN